MYNKFNRYSPKLVKGVNYKYDEKQSEYILDYLKWLVEQQSPSQSKEGVDFVNNLEKRIRKENPTALIERDAFGNVYVTKGKSKNYPLLVSHTDTNQELYGDLRMCRLEDLLYGMDLDTGLQAGAGFDDKIGVSIILTLLQKFDVCKVLLSVEEETGVISTSWAMQNNLSWFKNVSVCIQPDRRHNEGNNFISYSNGVDLHGKEFLDKCSDVMKKYGYSSHNGICTDVGVLKMNLDVACVNLSCAYENEHQSTEIAFVSKIMLCYDFINDLLLHLGTEVQYHPKQTVSYTNYGKSNRYSDPYIDEDLKWDKYYGDFEPDYSQDNLDYFKDAFNLFPDESWVYALAHDSVENGYELDLEDFTDEYQYKKYLIILESILKYQN